MQWVRRIILRLEGYVSGCESCKYKNEGQGLKQRYIAVYSADSWSVEVAAVAAERMDTKSTKKTKETATETAMVTATQR